MLLVPPPTRQRPPSTDGGFQIAWNSADGVRDEDVKKNAVEGKLNEDTSVSRLPRVRSESGRRRIQLFWQPLTRYEIELRTYCKSDCCTVAKPENGLFVLLCISHANYVLLKPNSITLAVSKLVRSWFAELVRSWFELKFGLSSSLLAANYSTS